MTLVVALSSALLMGCADDDSGDSSAADTSASDTAAGDTAGDIGPSAPSYATDVQPLLGAWCVGCHTGGASGGTNFANVYADNLADASATYAPCAGLTVGECALLRIADGSMPTTGSIAATVDPAELAIVQAWVDAGMPE